MKIAIFGLSITSAWGNGHATTYRALVRALARRGHRVTFYECQQPWYAAHRDLPRPGFCSVELYDDLSTLDRHLGGRLDADAVIVGSYVPDGVRVAEWVLNRVTCPVLFYDIDTPVTLAKLERGECAYLTPSLVPAFDRYLSFTGGPILERLRRLYGAHRPSPLYCSVDPEHYHPGSVPKRYDLGYLGTYSSDRQPKLETLLNAAARDWSAGRFCVAGAQYPHELEWPANVQRIEHLPPSEHCRFYNEQRFTLNVTRQDMVASGYSPSVRLFEAAACGVPIVSDDWPGLDELFVPGQEILITRSAEDTLRFVRDLAPGKAQSIGARARERVLAEHTGDHRAQQLEHYIEELSATVYSEARVSHAN